MANSFVDYFNGLAESLSADSKASGASSHNPDKGSNRENLVKNFLNRHLPRRLNAVLGGSIIGADGAESKQIDIIITNDQGVRFEHNDKTFVTAESVAAAISVKTSLGKREIEESVDNLASIPPLSKEAIEFKLLRNNPVEAFQTKYPKKYIFAFSGNSGESIHRIIHQIYCARALPPLLKGRRVLQQSECDEMIANLGLSETWIPAKMPHALIVNCSSIVYFNEGDRTDVEGKPVEKYKYVNTNLNDESVGYPLIWILNDLEAYVDWLNHMTVTTSPYFNNRYVENFLKAELA